MTRQKASSQQPTLPGMAQNDSGVIAPPTPGKKDKRWRGMFRFWLDATKPEQMELGQQLVELKSKRQFARVIRDGLTLFLDLRQGKTDVMRRLFPGMIAQIERDFAARQTAAQSLENTQFERLIRLQAEHMAKLERLVTVPAALPVSAAPATGGPRPLAAPPVAAPTFEEDEDADIVLDIHRDSSAGVDASRNFLNSVLAFAGGK